MLCLLSFVRSAREEWVGGGRKVVGLVGVIMVFCLRLRMCE